MKCLSCGADFPLDTTSCTYCNSSVPPSETRQRSITFARLRSSEAFAASGSPERIARLPKLGAFHKAFMIIFFTMFIGGSAFIFLMAVSMAGVFGVVGGAAAGGGGAIFSIVPLVMAIVPLAFVVLGIFMLLAAKEKMAKFESDPARAVPVLVIDKRTDVSGGSGDSSATTHYFVTCETENGSREEYQVWDGATYGRMSAGDAGILFLRSNHGLDFDRVNV